MMKKLLLVGCTMAMVCGVVSNASAQETVEEILVVFGTGMESSYTTPPGHQSIWSANGATVVTDERMYPFTASNILLDFDLSTDTSGGEFASAEYCRGADIGTWSVQLLSGSDIVFSAEGSVSWYDENEAPAGTIRGRGVLNLDGGIFIDESYDWGDDIELGGNGYDIGLNTELTDLTPADPVDYQTSFTSPSVTATFLADSSGIPEPVTVVLLGLGGLGVIGIRRRR